MHTVLARLRSKLRYLLRGREIDNDLVRELDFHREMLTEDQQRLGYDHEYRRPQRAPQDGQHRVDDGILARRLADRVVRQPGSRRSPTPSGPSSATQPSRWWHLTLALGIGANTAIFQLVDTVLLRGLPVERPEELLAVRTTSSYWRYEQLRDRNEVFSGLFAARALYSVTATVDGQPLGHPTTELVSGNYFSLLGVKPVLGRALTPDDDRAIRAGPVAVISHGLWQRAFGGSPEVLGRTLRMCAGSIGGGTSGFDLTPPESGARTKNC